LGGYLHTTSLGDFPRFDLFFIAFFKKKTPFKLLREREKSV
jgi:hypothetical protein